MAPLTPRFGSFFEDLTDRTIGDANDAQREAIARLADLLATFSGLQNRLTDAGGSGVTDPQRDYGVFVNDFADHGHGCGCAGCLLSEQRVVDAGAPTAVADAGAPTASVGGGQTLPVGTLQELADFLRVGFWQATDGVPRKYNLETTGPNPKGGVITYNLSGFSDVGGYTDGNGLVSDRRELVREVFKLYEEILGIDFRETSGAADMYFSDNQSGAYAFSSGWSEGIDFSVVNVAANWQNGKSGYDSYTLQTFFHEVGHALGLGHQGAYNGSASFPGDANFANDSWQATMMSYFSQTANTVVTANREFLQTPMSVDWLALDDIYGGQRANGVTFGTANAFLGDTVYGFNTNIASDISDIWARFSDYAYRTASTLIDSGGNDTLNLSGYAADQRIDLTVSRANDREPVTSDVGGRIGNLTIAVGTVIENAKGGSGNDSFTGNLAANSFWGNAGNDRFYDTVGTDTYYGGAGSDTVVFASVFDGFELAYDAAMGFLEVFDSAVGGITALVESTVEWLSFDGTTVAFDDVIMPSVQPGLPAARIQAIKDHTGTLRGDVMDGLTNDTTPMLVGSVSEGLPAGGTLNVYRDGSAIGSAKVTGTNWRFVDRDLEDGVYDYQVAVQAGGETGPFSNIAKLTVDATAPTITVSPITTTDATPELSGTVASDAVAVTVTLDGTAYEADVAGGAWALPEGITPELDPGSYSVLARAVDAAGNTGEAGGTVTIGAPQSGGAVMAIGSLSVSQDHANQWHSVVFDAAISGAVVAAGGLTNNGPQPAHVRIRDVTDTGFEFKIEEWDYSDKLHTAETVSWIAVSAGTHDIGGLTVEAGNGTARNEQLETMQLSPGFGDAPVVFAQVASDEGDAAVTTRLLNIDSDSFQFQMQEEEQADGIHGMEQIHWIAIEAGDGIYFDAMRTPDAVSDSAYRIEFGTPAPEDAVFLAAMQSRDGRDTADTRVAAFDPSGATVFIGEEQSSDLETTHSNETVGYLLGSEGLYYV